MWQRAVSEGMKGVAGTARPPHPPPPNWIATSRQHVVVLPGKYGKMLAQQLGQLGVRPFDEAPVSEKLMFLWILSACVSSSNSPNPFRLVFLAAELFSFLETRSTSSFIYLFIFGLLGDDNDNGGDGDNGDGKQRDLWFCPSPSISVVIEDGDGGGGCDDDEMQGDGLDLQKGEELKEKKRWVLGEPRPRKRKKKRVWVLERT
ncbi:hypothetical protein SLEP1_g29799 [Rubroshorea leprosula]|uniref:Uncharacterized protein n=1 Tax=Rubroshorea leprosula TaxID=152421 RepID=A0AAV5K482_9ROSI|nr:hypothetical protein SLEP1_g29799 [Rubroshorea leprosula]